MQRFTHPRGRAPSGTGPPPPSPVQSPTPAPLWDSSFANGGTRVSHLTGRTVVAETRGAMKLMQMYADDER